MDNSTFRPGSPTPACTTWWTTTLVMPRQPPGTLSSVWGDVPYPERREGEKVAASPPCPGHPGWGDKVCTLLVLLAPCPEPSDRLCSPLSKPCSMEGPRAAAALTLTDVKKPSLHWDEIERWVWEIGQRVQWN